MSTDDILDAIDHALRDVSVGADAMRWSPEEPAEDAKDPTGRHATDVLVGREERPAADAWDARERDEATARYRAALAADPELREYPGGDLSEWAFLGYTEDGAAIREMGSPQRLFEVTHREPASLAGHMERALARMEGRQERAQQRMEGARETYSVLDEIRRWTTDPRSPIARAGHDFSRTNRTCPGCAAIRDANHRAVMSGQSTQDLTDLHVQWDSEHRWIAEMMARYRIPMREDNPLPYYRALWRNARTHGDRVPPDVPYCRLDARTRAGIPRLLLGGASPWDGSVIYLDQDMEAINVVDTSVQGMDFRSFMDPVMPPIPQYTYQAHRFLFHYLGQEYTEWVYLYGILERDATGIVFEALERGLIGPRARRGGEQPRIR